MPATASSFRRSERGCARRGADDHQAHVRRRPPVVRSPLPHRAGAERAPADPALGPKILVGGGCEKRTLRLLARHGDIGHWLGGPLEDLKRKKGIFEQHCEAEGRDPSTVMLTIGMNIVLVENENEAEAAVARVPEQRRPMVSVATPAEAAEMMRPFLDAGFGGFTLSNMTQPNAESIALAGELIKLVRGSQVAA